VIKVSVSLRNEAVWAGKNLILNQFEDDVKMSLDYLEELTNGRIDFYVIIDHQFSPNYVHNRIDDMRDKLQNPYFNGNLIEMYFVERG
jgi:hypothetical protein